MLGVLVAAEMVAGSNLEGFPSLANFANFALYKKNKLLQCRFSCVSPVFFLSKSILAFGHCRHRLALHNGVSGWRGCWRGAILDTMCFEALTMPFITVCPILRS